MTNPVVNALVASENLRESSWRDHARNLVLAAVQAIPGVGGTLGSLLSDYLPNWKQERVLSFLEELAADFERVKGQVNKEAVATAEFGLMVEQVLRRVTETPGEEKRKAYRALLLNACLASDSEEREREYFLSRLTSLDEIHVAILAMLTNSVEVQDRLRSRLGKPDVVEGAYRDLQRMGLVLDSANAPGHLLTRDDAQYLRNLRTPLGLRFTAFITLPT